MSKEGADGELGGRGGLDGDGTARDVPWHNADSRDAPRVPACGLDALCAELAAAWPG
ncbi:hypothetical protein LTT66_36505 [Nocardia gipuzkoensis]|uniref:hypothetical protein n=1 Tax=Nocardia gipuzkoensis TaxID=2749991 RepID=UPI001E3C038A|nr:hypothetical protein [Nocardia gipuzkoensis]UGT68569.1 hypothetical protein LTT66_36505 [Nocardia gipuzkoensis]